MNKEREHFFAYSVWLIFLTVYLSGCAWTDSTNPLVARIPIILLALIAFLVNIIVSTFFSKKKAHKKRENYIYIFLLVAAITTLIYAWMNPL